MKVALCRRRNYNYSKNCNQTRSSNCEIFIWKSYEINQKIKQHVCKDFICFPKKPLDYQVIEEKGPYLENVKLEKLYYLTPSCKGGLLSVEYFLKVKLFFDAIFTSNEELCVPLDFTPRPEQSQINNHYFGQSYAIPNVINSAVDNPINNTVSNAFNAINSNEATPCQFNEHQNNINSNGNEKENKTNKENEQNDKTIDEILKDYVIFDSNGCDNSSPTSEEGNKK